MSEIYKAVVTTKRDPLTLRNAPEGDKIGKLPRGAMVSVMAQSDGWAYVAYGGMSGYCAASYLTRCEQEEGAVHVALGFQDSAGNTWTPMGDFSAKLVAVDD